MVPTLGISLDTLNNHGYINGFDKDGLRFEQYEDVVYLLFKPTDWSSFTEFVESEYTRTPSIIDDYDYEEGHVVLVYKLNSLHFADFNLVRQGKYSETSEVFQKLFKEEVTIITNGIISKEKSFQNLIFYKSKKLRDHWKKETGFEIPNDKEVWPIFDINKETLKL
jgi:hypothetical protein